MFSCYFRFLPNGSYINASKLKAEKLAKEMYDIINDAQRYNDFFKWHGYYSFEDISDNDHRETLCGLCAFFNSVKLKPDNSAHIYHDIVSWWNDKTQSAGIRVPDSSDQFSSVMEPEENDSLLSNLFNFLFDNE